MATSDNVPTRNSIGPQRAASTAAHSAVSLKDMRAVASARHTPLANGHHDAHDAHDAYDAPAATGGGYYTTTAVLPMAETFPTAKRLQHKYTISGTATPLGVSQALRVQKPTASHGAGAGAGGGVGGGNGRATSTSLSVTAYTQRSLQALLRKHTIACSWRRNSGGAAAGAGGSHWWRWSLCGGVSVLLLCMIGYFVWLRGLPHGVTVPAAVAVAEEETINAFTITTITTSTTERPQTRATTYAYTRQRTNALNAHEADAKAGAGVTEWPRSTKALPPPPPPPLTQEELQEDDWYDEGLLEPNESVEAAAAVQNLTVLRLQPLDNRLHDEHENTSPPAVSPTLPPLRHWSTAGSGATNATPQGHVQSQQPESGCRSTTLPLCQGVLAYDLTSGAAAASAATVQLSADERLAFQLLTHSNCSARALEFVCTVLEPECRSGGVILPPCRRICKAIREACSLVVPSSDVLTALFDCSAYPDSTAADECEDPTRRRDYCYENEFACEDRTCIPHQWQCDNIKDCAAGDDEERCLLCDQPDEFRCRSNEKCVAAAQRCDQREDCFDGSDERNCDDFLYSEDFALDAFHPAGDVAAYNDADAPSALLAKYNELLQSSATFNRSGAGNDGGGEGVGEGKGDITNIVPSESKAQGFVHFRDSKEIMMTSDSENKFKYSSTTRGNRTYSNNNTSNNNTSNTSHNNKSNATAAPPPPPTSTPPSATTRRTASGAGQVCAPHQLRCVSGHCITVQQICDKKIDCPDGADELMCVYKQRNGATASAANTATATASTASINSSTSSSTSSITSSSSSSSTTTATTQRQPLDAKRKTTIRKLRGQYQQQQQQQQQQHQSHG